MTVLAPPLDAVSRVARIYPSFLLNACETGLALFAAAFLGQNDAIHFARAGMTGTCVDIDTDRLAEMREIYPDDWRFVEGDAWEFARAAADVGERWDAVSVDTFTGGTTNRSLDSLELWCSIANRLVTATIVNDQPYTAPDGWRATLHPRTWSRPISWLVLTRESE